MSRGKCAHRPAYAPRGRECREESEDNQTNRAGCCGNIFLVDRAGTGNLSKRSPDLESKDTALFGLSIPASKNTSSCRPRNSASIAGAAERETHAGYQFSSSGHLSRRRRDDLALLPSSPARRGACVLFSLRFRASFIISWIGCHGLMVLHHHDIRLCVVLSILSEHKIWDLFDLVGFGSHMHF